MEGRIESKYFFETVLAKGLLPFRIFRRELVFLPVTVRDERPNMVNAEHMTAEGDIFAATWAMDVEKLWEANRSSKDRDIYQWLNYNNKLSNQLLNIKYIVVYNTSGSNIAAALVTKESVLDGVPVNGFIADAKTYYYYPKTRKEGDYLCAVLNSNVVNKMIKKYQPQGLFGARDIHRRPFEVCPIPVFNTKNSRHAMLAELGRDCRKTLKGLNLQEESTIGRTRTAVRKLIATELGKIDKDVVRITEGKRKIEPIQIDKPNTD